MNSTQFDTIYVNNYKKLANATPNKHVLVVNTSIKGRPQFEEFTQFRAAMTTKKFGANPHLLFGKETAPHLQTLRSRLVYETKRMADPIKTAAISKIESILTSYGISPSVTNVEADTNLANIAEAANRKIAPPLPPRDDDSGSDSDWD